MILLALLVVANQGQTGPTPINPQLWITDRDYPAGPAREHVQGDTGFLLDVNANGRVDKCTITAPSGSAALDKQTCSRLSFRGRFTPPRDPQGNPVASTYSGTFHWRLPGVR